jgi:putative endonuclease
MSEMARRQRGSSARSRGKWAEALCVLSLTLRGWWVMDRSVVTGRGTRAGEIDIVARRGRVLAFIEVKARPDLDQAAAAISMAQQQRLVRGAEAYLARHPQFAGLEPRFDAMLVAPGRWPRHLMDAWSCRS